MGGESVREGDGRGMVGWVGVVERSEGGGGGGGGVAGGGGGGGGGWGGWGGGREGGFCGRRERYRIAAPNSRNGHYPARGSGRTAS